VIVAEQFPAPFGRYHLLSRLAVGGMAELFLARAEGASDDAPFAVIKRLLPHLASQTDFIDMFLDEARLTSQLHHPGLARIYEFGQHEGQYFIAMEFVDGIDVLTMLRECAAMGRRLAPGLGVHIVHQLLDALDYVHTRTNEHGQPLCVVHRDVSPSNVLVSQTGEVKLIDFGIARATERRHRTRAGLLKGKAGYMSPEQVSRGEIDARSDIFSAAVVLAELLIGRRLFVAPRELDTLLMVRYARLDRLDRYGYHVDAELQGVLRQGLRQHPEDRYGSAAEFRDALAGWLREGSHLPEHLDRVVGSVAAAAPVPGADPGHASEYESEHESGHESDPTGALAVSLGVLVRKLYPRVWRRRQHEKKDGTEPSVAAPAADARAGASTRRSEPRLRDTLPDMMPAGTQAPEEATVMMPSPFDSLRDDSKTDDLRIEDLAAEPAARLSIAPSPAVAPTAAPAPASEAAGPPGGAEPAASTRDTMHGLPLALLMESMAASAMPGLPGLPDMAEVSDTAAPGPAEAADAAGAHADAAGADLIVLAPATSSAASMLLGSLAATSPLAVLCRLGRERATGRLSMTTGELRKDIHVRAGEAMSVVSNVFSEHFAEYLIRQGAVSPGELSMVLAMVAQYQDSLDDALVSLQLMTAGEVAQHRAGLVRQQIIDVCTWRRGSYHWLPRSDEAGPDAGPEADAGIDLLPVIGSGALAVSDETVIAWLDHMEPLDQARPRLHRADAAACKAFALGSAMDDVCKLLDGTQSVAAVRARFATGRRESTFLRILHLLDHAGLVTIAHDQAAQPSRRERLG
jgi:serine/threonine protein kinase